MLKRSAGVKAARLLERFPVLTILGARQVGKTTLARELGHDGLYIDLENPADRSRVMAAPELFFADHPRRVIFDEAQSCPEIFNILRGVIDQDRSAKGRFILTGSSSFELVSGVSESLAGRVGLIELHPLTVNERLERLSSPFFDLFQQPVSTDWVDVLLGLVGGRPGSDASREAMLVGGYPESCLEGDPEFRQDWYENYFRTYIERDILRQFPGLDLMRYRRVVRMLSHVSHTVINRSEIARSVECSEAAVRDYMDIVEGTYFWRSLPAFRTSKIKTTVKLPKGHFRDAGLCCFLQNLTDASQLETFPRLGHLFEAFIVEELIRGLEAGGARQLRYSHFRTKAGGEIDLILEGNFGCLPIEVKYGALTTARELRSMSNFIDLLDLPLGIVLNHAPRPRRITEKIIELPVTMLWSHS